MKTAPLVAIAVAFAAYIPAVGAAPGDVDTNFNPTPNSDVYSVAIQPDGTILMDGIFTSIGGLTRNNVARLNVDGTLDSSFNPNANNEVRTTATQSDGRILIGGFFGTVGGIVRNHIARLNLDGTVDTTFDPDADNTVNSIAVQPDGKILVGGFFASIGGTTRNFIARLNSDGTLDSGFDPNANNAVRSTVVMPDGSILVSGDFTTIGGVTCNHVAKLNADGTLDATFNPNVNGGTWGVAVQADGRIVIGGDFSTVGGVQRLRIARLNADGTLDTTFTCDAPGGGGVRSMVGQTDGKVVIGFNAAVTIGGVTRNGVVRINADGTLDPVFGPNVNSYVQGVAVQSDGKVIIGGAFTTLNGATCNRIARLDNDIATQSLTVQDRSRVQWLRGGSSPETLQVAFDLSTDGGATWSPLGVGTRITGGWELTGLTLPVAGSVRARANCISGLGNGSAGLVEAVTMISPKIAIEQPPGTNISNGGSQSFGTLVVGTNSDLTFTIKNIGVDDLTGLSVTEDGTDQSDFTITTNPSGPVSGPTGSTTFTVRFLPSTGGAKTAAIHIASNDPVDNPFTINFTGQSLSFTQDTDGDGLSDAAEFLLAPLGFDWQVSQPDLVKTLFSNANAAGLFTAAQVQALNVSAPLIQRDPTTGRFTLTIGVEESTDLKTFVPFPMTAPQTIINAQGKLEFQFTVPNNAAFFRIEAH